MTTTLHLMHGFIGSGKTTFAKQLESKTGALRLSMDRWTVGLLGHNPPIEGFDEMLAGIRSLQWELTEQLLARGTSVILDYGFWKRAERDTIRAKASALHIPMIWYSSTAPRELMRDRTLARNTTLDAETMWIEDNTFDVLWPRFEPLGADEEAVLF